MGVARARVEAKNVYASSQEEKDKNLKGLIHALRRACSTEGVLREYRRHQTYEKPGEKRRRKQREARANRLKGMRQRMRDSFTDRKRDSE